MGGSGGLDNQHGGFFPLGGTRESLKLLINKFIYHGIPLTALEHPVPRESQPFVNVYMKASLEGCINLTFVAIMKCLRLWTLLKKK